MKLYDTIIIGAGIAGTSLAHILTQKNQKVLVLDKNGIASGGSGAAGAFVSPKIGLASPLHSLTNEAFEYAKDFYLKHCPEYYAQTGVVRIPKDDADAKKFPIYEKANSNLYELYESERLKAMGIDVPYNGFFFPEAGACEALDICAFLLKDIEVEICNIDKITYKDGMWSVLRQAQEPIKNTVTKSVTELVEVRAKNVVIATGFENKLFDMDYMGVHGVWGNRGDFSSTLDLPISMHQSMSVSANVDGIIKLGATHERSVQDVQLCEEKESLKLKEMASELIDTSDLELTQMYCGMRAGSRDSFPLIGKVIDVESMLAEHPSIKKGRKFPLKYINNLYVYNGLGGRGFVFAPMMAQMLAEHIVDKKEIDVRVNPDRLFWKWARKL